MSWPYMILFGAFLDVPTIMLLDRLQLGVCLDALTTYQWVGGCLSHADLVGSLPSYH